MTGGQADAEEVLEKRSRFLAATTGEPKYPRDLIDELDVSRSTVTRGLRELETLGWVRQTDEGYVTTLAGRLAHDSYREHASSLDTIQDATGVLADLPADLPLSPAVLAERATVHLADETGPHALAETLVERTRDADRLWATVPAVVDTGLLRAWRSVVERGGTVSLVAAKSAADRLRDHGSAAVEALRGSDRCRLSVDERERRVGVALLDCDGRTELLVAVHDDHGSLAAVVESANPEAVEWARRTLSVADEAAVVWDGDDVPSVGSLSVTDVDAVDGGEAAPLDEDSPLRAEGFRAITDAYFEARSPLPPAKTLRAGATLVEVADGQTLPREHVVDGERRSLTDDVRGELERGVDCAIVGPPGSGKSTVCRQVAHRWHEAGNGPVLYRESETGIAFESADRLEAVLRESEGHVLVVVEDAVRSEAGTVFEVADALGGDESVSFLVDARRSEWVSTSERPDARRSALRHARFETVPMPPLDDREVERLLAHFDDRLDAPVPSPEEVGDFLPTDDAPTGDLLLLLHHLGMYADDPMGESDRVPPTPTTLVEDVQATYRDLEACPVDSARTVGFHLALLIAAGFDHSDDLVYALAVHPEGPDVGAVRDVLDVLEGTVLLRTGDGEARTVHESWGAWFLKAVRDAEDESRLHHRFARSTNAVLALADDGERRDRLAALCGPESPHLDRLETDPTGWLSDVLDRVFGIGRRWHGLTAMYGRTDRSLLDVPDACPPWLRARTCQWRAEMFIDDGDYDAAEGELAALPALLDDLRDETTARRLRAWTLERRAYVAQRRGEFEAAREDYTTALERYRDLGDARGEAEALNGLGLLDWFQHGDFAAATDRLTAALERYETAGDRKGEANCRNNLGVMARDRGDLDEAARWFEEAHDIRRAIGAGHHVVDSLINLGVVARDRGDLDRAVARCRRALERARDLGGSDYTAHSMRALGNTLRRRDEGDDLAEAEQYLERALERDRESGVRFSEGHCLRGLAAVHRRRGDVEAARECIADAEAAYEDAGGERDLALARRERGRIAHAEGDHETARELLAESVRTLEGTDRVPGLAATRVAYAEALLALGEVDEARRELEVALDRYRAVGAERYASRVAGLLDDAREQAEETGADGEESGRRGST